MARLNKQEQELKSIEQFKSWFDTIDQYIKMLVVFVFGVSLISYLATLTAGFIHLIGVISRYETGFWGGVSVFAIAVGLIGTEFSAVYGVVYEDLQTRVTGKSKSTKKSGKKKVTEKEKVSKDFLDKIGIHSFIEFSMWFMALITGFANFLYSLYIVRELQLADEGRKVGFVLLEHIIGPNTIDDHFAIDPVTILALFLFSTIIPVIMIVQSKMQIQFLRYIIKTIESIKRARSNAENKVNEKKAELPVRIKKESNRPVESVKVIEPIKAEMIKSEPVKTESEPEVKVIARKPIPKTEVKTEDEKEFVVDAFSNENKLSLPRKPE